MTKFDKSNLIKHPDPNIYKSEENIKDLFIIKQRSNPNIVSKYNQFIKQLVGDVFMNNLTKFDYKLIKNAINHHNN